MFRVVKLRRHGKRDERNQVLRDPGLVGKIDMHFITGANGVGQVKVLRLSSAEMKAGQFEVLGTLEQPDFQTFTGDVFLVKGVETDDQGRQFIQEWWGRREHSAN